MRITKIEKIQKRADLVDITTSSGTFIANGVITHNCDAWYTWNPHTEEFWTEMHDMPIEECVKDIKNAWGGPYWAPKRVVWTGGEPLIQRKQIEQASRLFGDDWEMEIETNGTLMPTKYLMETAQFNCSPKLQNSDNREGSRIKPKILAALSEVNSTFKFVSMTEEDLDEILEDFLPHMKMEQIIVMPQGILEEEVSMNAKRLAEPCKDRGLRLMPRLQNICWDGARRGV